ncbi:MAG: hypothetical protein KAT91_03560 [Candidatus Aenigmarchaeota archaeon]|nr:hypothetical protein [Candidatus Aenigmarchaeota archaeon]
MNPALFARAQNKRRRKGQYLAIEEILLFGMGLAIFGGTLLITDNFKEDTTQTISEIKLMEVSQVVLNGIYTVQKINSTTKITIDIPKKIASEEYVIVGSENQKELVVYNSKKVLVKAKTPVKVSGTVHSTNGKILLMTDGSKVFMRGVSNY